MCVFILCVSVFVVDHVWRFDGREYKFPEIDIKPRDLSYMSKHLHVGEIVHVLP